MFLIDGPPEIADTVWEQHFWCGGAGGYGYGSYCYSPSLRSRLRFDIEDVDDV